MRAIALLLRCVGVVLAFACVLGGRDARAHEIGTTRVTAAFGDRDTYAIQIVTDAATLAEKLRAAAGLAAPTDSQPDRLRAILESSSDIFRRRLGVTFDGAPVQPAVAFFVAPADGVTGAVATIRLTGEVPTGARQFSWRYGWTFASYAMTVEHGGKEQAATVWLEGDETSAPFALESPAPAPGRINTVLRYVTLGFTHILPKGLDHILFVLGIFLFSRRLRPVLWQVSAFTVAHSITLGLALYGAFSLPPSIVEPLIALSIVYVAFENIVTSELKPWRVALVFAFGLLHGMGFAGALRELALPRSEFLTGLVSFNVGVEAGQLTVIAAASLLVAYWSADASRYRRLIVVPASLVIAVTGAYWTVARLPLW